MRTVCLLIVASLTGTGVTCADTSSEITKEAALKGIDACMHRKDVSSDACLSLQKNLGTLVDLYGQGDKTVLPTLLRFTYLTSFFDQALVADPEGFLSTVANLPEAQQQSIANGLSGDIFGLPLQRFDTVRATLKNLPDSSPNRKLANRFLATLEAFNASYLLDYSFPWKFVDRSGDFEDRWFSKTINALGGQALWPPPPGTTATYRLTVLPCLSVQETVSLSIWADGTGHVSFRSMAFPGLRRGKASSHTLNAQQMAKFLAALDLTDFWNMPTRVRDGGFDGAEWILEGARGDTYHFVERWCPHHTPFAKSGHDLFRLAHQWGPGGC